MPTIEKKGYKYTEEFGYIPEDWEVKNIVKTSNLKARIGWQGLTTAEYLNNGEYLLVTGTDFDNGKINWQSCFYVEKKRYDQDTNIQLKNGDVLITKDGTIGKVAYIDSLPKPTTLNSGVFVVRPLNEAYNTKYFYYLLQSNIFISFLNKLKAGSTIVHLYQKDLSNFDYIIPSDVKEQEKIAEVLGDVDNLIDKTQQLINKKKDLKTATMQKLLTPKEDWIKSILGEYVRVQGGYSFNSEKFINNGIPIIRISNIYNDDVIIDNETVFYEPINISKEFIINEGDVLIAMSGATTGKVGMYRYKKRAYQNQRVGKFVAINKDTVMGYIKQFLKSHQFINELNKSIAQGAQPNISSKQIEEIELVIPSRTEQEQISTILSDMDYEIEALEKELNKYKDLKTGMMQQLLTGKIRLIDSKIKPDKVVEINSIEPKKEAPNEFKDAILISMLAYKFGSEQYPLGAFRRQKLSYLFKRHNNIPIDEYMKKAMGPYNPKMKYQGAEGIALRNKYVKEVNNRGLIATNSISKAEEYYNRYYQQESLDWLDTNFHYESNNNLEVLTTVDYAIIDLRNQNKDITLENIKTYISSDEEWKPKLKLDYFTDEAITKAMETSKILLNSY